jgi:predicted SprT family Zn-dependent metalloprotease
MNAREKGLKNGTLYGKLVARDLNLAPLATVRKVSEKVGESEEALKCPCCFKPIMTGWNIHTYVQYSHYVCKHCEADLIFIAFSDHPDKKDLRFADLVMLN